MTSWKMVHVFGWFKGLSITHVHISCPMETREITEACEVCGASNYQVSSRIIRYPTLLKHICPLNFSILSEAGSYKGSFPFTASFSNGVTPENQMAEEPRTGLQISPPGKWLPVSGSGKSGAS